MINVSTIQDLLKTVQSLQANMVALKSGATGGSNPLTRSSAPATLPQNGSDVCGKSPPRKNARDDDEADSPDDLSSDEEDNVFTLSEVGSVFMETAFKNKIECLY